MPAKIESTHQLIKKKLVVYRRPDSDAWQCRYTVDGKKWHCKTTGLTELEEAIPKAHEILIAARLLKERNLPVVSKKVSDIAKLAIQKMDDNVGYEAGSDSFPQYKRIINDFIVPFFGKKHIDSITPKMMGEFDKWRTKKLGKPLAYSSVRKHNVTLNRIFQEALERGYVHKTQIPYLETKGVKSKTYAHRGSTENFPYNTSPIGKLLTMGDLNVQGNETAKVHFDSMSRYLIANHNVWVMLDAFERANKAAFDDSSQKRVPEKISKCIRLIEEAFKVDDWRGFLASNKEFFDSIAANAYLSKEEVQDAE